MEETKTFGKLVDAATTTKAYTSRDFEDWEETSNTTNPIESVNRQSFKSKNNLNVILENMYLEDRVHAVKMAARSRNINITYLITSKKKNKKRKRASLVNDTERARRRGKALINTTVEVEYKEKNEEGNLTYLGWLTGTIIAYNSRQGCLVQFKNQKDCSGNETGDWTDWTPSVNSSDVRIPLM